MCLRSADFPCSYYMYKGLPMYIKKSFPKFNDFVRYEIKQFNEEESMCVGSQYCFVFFLSTACLEYLHVFLSLHY